MNANVGMICPVAAVCSYSPGSSPTYSGGKIIAEAVAANLTWNRADGHFYGDDMELDSENGVLGYTMAFEPTGLTDEARGLLLGETVSSGEYTINEDPSPDVGFGYVRVMRLSSTGGVNTSYEGWWYYKMKFGVSSEETRTKGQNIEWRTPTLNGTGAGVQKTSGGKLDFATHKTFSDKASAIAYVKGKAGIT